MKDIKLSNGFTVTVEDNAFDNMELLDALEEAQGDNPLAFSKAMKMVLGTDQRKKLYDHIKAEKKSDVVTPDEIADVFTEIVEGLGDTGKN